jgi:hypothetical protein
MVICEGLAEAVEVELPAQPTQQQTPVSKVKSEGRQSSVPEQMGDINR